MNKNKDMSDDFFEGEFTENEKNTAAQYILEKQDNARSSFIFNTVINTATILFIVCLLITYIVSFSELYAASQDPNRINSSSRVLPGKAGIVQSFLYVPIMLIFIGTLITGIIKEYNDLSVYNSYKVYKGIISHIEKNDAFSKIPLYNISVMLTDKKEINLDYNISDTEALEYARKTEIILIDFIKICKPKKAKNYIYDSVITDKQKWQREQDTASKLNKYILIPCQQAEKNDQKI